MSSRGALGVNTPYIHVVYKSAPDGIQNSVFLLMFFIYSDPVETITAPPNYLKKIQSAPAENNSPDYGKKL